MRLVWTFRFVALCLVGALMTAATVVPVRAGDGQVLHVGETTTLDLEGRGWTLDAAASRQAQLVSVRSAGGTGASQRYVLRGLKTGQATLVFRSGPKTFKAHIDVLR